MTQMTASFKALLMAAALTLPGLAMAAEPDAFSPAAGAWGRGGLVRGPKGIIAQTADGLYDPASGKFG